MIAIGAFIYGMALSVTFAILGRNRRERRDHPLALVLLGYLLCGASIGIAGTLAMIAMSGEATAAGISPLLM